MCGEWISLEETFRDPAFSVLSRINTQIRQDIYGVNSSPTTSMPAIRILQKGCSYIIKIPGKYRTCTGIEGTRIKPSLSRDL